MICGKTPSYLLTTVDNRRVCPDPNCAIFVCRICGSQRNKNACGECGSLSDPYILAKDPFMDSSEILRQFKSKIAASPIFS